MRCAVVTGTGGTNRSKSNLILPHHLNCVGGISFLTWQEVKGTPPRRDTGKSKSLMGFFFLSYPQLNKWIQIMDGISWARYWVKCHMYLTFGSQFNKWIPALNIRWMGCQSYQSMQCFGIVLQLNFNFFSILCWFQSAVLGVPTCQTLEITMKTVCLYKLKTFSLALYLNLKINHKNK